MKKIIALLLAALLLLTGCEAADIRSTTAPETTGAAETEEASVAASVPETTEAPEGFNFPTSPNGSIMGPMVPGESLAFANPGKVRIAYTGNVSYVKYITSVEQLPDVEALAGYDAEYFENHALLIVVETYSSGSMQVELEDIRVSGDTAVMSLKRTMDGEVGTADMATWLLWAEVEKGLDYTWCIKDRPQEPVGEKY